VPDRDELAVYAAYLESGAAVCVTTWYSMEKRAAEARIQYMRRAPIIAAAVLLAGLCLAPLFAQRYTYRQYDSAYGLTDMAVHCLLQDRAGFIWAGTDNGLFRYDGSHFRAFHAEDGLPHPTIRAIAESPQGVVWVGTNDGVAKFIGNRFQKVEVGEAGHFLAIAFDSLGRLYVESPTGLIRGIADVAGNYRFQKIASGAIRGFFVNQEDIWFVRDKDLWHLRGDREERVGSTNGLPEDLWNSIVQDTKGTFGSQVNRGFLNFLTDRAIFRSARRIYPRLFTLRSMPMHGAVSTSQVTRALRFWMAMTAR